MAHGKAAPGVRCRNRWRALRRYRLPERIPLLLILFQTLLLLILNNVTVTGRHRRGE